MITKIEDDKISVQKPKAQIEKETNKKALDGFEERAQVKPNKQ